MSTAESTESTPPRRQSPRRRESGSRGRPRIWFVAAIVVGLLVLGTAGWLGWSMVQDGDAERVPASADVFTSSSTTETLTDREVDPRDLTEPELFGRGGEELSSQGHTFTLEEGELSADCTGAVWGERPQDAMSRVDCSQVVRAAYSGDDHIATVTLFNLSDVAGSEALAESLQPAGNDSDGFVTLMDTEAVEDLGVGYSASEITVQGHYLMVTWVQERTSTDPEERDSLGQPLRTLSNFEMPLFRRLLEHDRDDAGDAEGADAEESAQDPAAGEDAGEEPGEQPEEESAP